MPLSETCVSSPEKMQKFGGCTQAWCDSLYPALLPSEHARFQDAGKLCFPPKPVPLELPKFTGKMMSLCPTEECSEPGSVCTTGNFICSKEKVWVPLGPTASEPGSDPMLKTIATLPGSKSLSEMETKKKKATQKKSKTGKPVVTVYDGPSQPCELFDFSINGFKKDPKRLGSFCIYDGTDPAVAKKCQTPVYFERTLTRENFEKWAFQCNVTTRQQDS